MESSIRAIPSGALSREAYEVSQRTNGEGYSGFGAFLFVFYKVERLDRLKICWKLKRFAFTNRELKVLPPLLMAFIGFNFSLFTRPFLGSIY